MLSTFGSRGRFLSTYNGKHVFTVDQNTMEVSRYKLDGSLVGPRNDYGLVNQKRVDEMNAAAKGRGMKGSFDPILAYDVVAYKGGVAILTGGLLSGGSSAILELDEEGNQTNIKTHPPRSGGFRGVSLEVDEDGVKAHGYSLSVETRQLVKASLK